MNEDEVLLVLLIIYSILSIMSVHSLIFENIVGGYNVQDDDMLEVRHQAFISGRNLLSFIFSPLCGCIIIHKRFALSAGHCFINEDGEFEGLEYIIIFGAKDFFDPAGIILEIDQIYVHEDYLINVHDSDIAVVELRDDFPNAEDVIQWEIAVNYDPYDGAVGTVFGYGYSSLSSLSQSRTFRERVEDNKLKYIHVRIFSSEVCMNRTFNYISEKKICASSITTDPRDSWGLCYGDSGAGLLFGNLVIGIASTIRHNCKDSEDPVVYTRLSYFAEFITNVMEGSPSRNSPIYRNP